MITKLAELCIINLLAQGEEKLAKKSTKIAQKQPNLRVVRETTAYNDIVLKDWRNYKHIETGTLWNFNLVIIQTVTAMTTMVIIFPKSLPNFWNAIQNPKMLYWICF